MKCSRCLIQHWYPPHQQGHPTGWWHFSRYRTATGDEYTGSYCPSCSRKVYAENKQLPSMEPSK